MSNFIDQIKIISDLHIGSKNKADDFYLNEKDFMDYITRWLDKPNNLIILNGDIFECWEADTFFTNSDQQFANIRKKRRKLCDFLINTERIILVNGNHDAVIRTGEFNCGAVENFTHTFDNKYVIHAAHGHQSDFANSNKGERLGKCITKCVSAGENLIHPDLDIELGKLDDICRAPRDDFISQEHAIKLAKKNKYDVVIYGHTHTPLIYKEGSIVYANSGHGRDYKDSIDEVIVSCKSNGLTINVLERNIKTDEIKQVYGFTTLGEIGSGSIDSGSIDSGSIDPGSIDPGSTESTESTES